MQGHGFFWLTVYKYMHAYIHTYTCIHTYVHSYIHIYIHTYIYTYMHPYIDAYIPRAIRNKADFQLVPLLGLFYTCMYIPASVHSYLHTNMHMYMYMQSCVQSRVWHSLLHFQKVYWIHHGRCTLYLQGIAAIDRFLHLNLLA